MATTSSKRAVFGGKEHVKCSPSCPHLIYDDPYIFRVRSQRPVPHVFPCETCLRNAKRQQQSSTPNIQYPKRCSRLSPTPVDLERANRPRTSPSRRTSNSCNWDNFMQKKSKYAIQTPYAQCDLINNQQDFEDRPPFVNYGGRYHDKQGGEKRTFNSLAVHQLKHQEVDDERVTNVFRERRLRQQAEDYFREMERRKFDGQNRSSETEYQDNYQSSEDYNGQGTFSRD